MVHIYEKTCKTKENSYGLIELDDAETFKKGPCIITIIAGPVSKKSINGSLRQTAHLINPDIDIKYDKDTECQSECKCADNCSDDEAWNVGNRSDGNTV